VDTAALFALAIGHKHTSKEPFAAGSLVDSGAAEVKRARIVFSTRGRGAPKDSLFISSFVPPSPIQQRYPFLELSVSVGPIEDDHDSALVG